MTEHPILFSDPMVRAILAGTKMQTRRVVKPQPDGAAWYQKPGHSLIGRDAADMARKMVDDCPYGQPGDRLWVREAWALIDKDYKPADLAQATALVYRADGLKVPNQRDPEIRATFADRCRMPLDAIKWRPSIHMPRIASRIDLEITGVRVERLNDISEADAVAEGVNVHPDHHGKPRNSIYSPVQAYCDLWESINGPDSWAANPWVWCLTFKRV